MQLFNGVGVPVVSFVVGLNVRESTQPMQRCNCYIPGIFSEEEGQTKGPPASLHPKEGALPLRQDLSHSR